MSTRPHSRLVPRFNRRAGRTPQRLVPLVDQLQRYQVHPSTRSTSTTRDLRSFVRLGSLAQHHNTFPIIGQRTMSMHIPSEARMVKDMLEGARLTKWGYMVYRTTYESESDWTRFKAILNENARLMLRESDTPELLASFEYTFIEDRELDGATVAELRKRFLEWRDGGAAQAEQPEAIQDVTTVEQPRFDFFVRADATGVRSVLAGGDGAFVHFAQALWVPDGDEYEGDLLEEIEGCHEEDVGWFKMQVAKLPVDAYVAFALPSGWRLEYARPPQLSVTPPSPMP